jgi:hypothetical protein
MKKIYFSLLLIAYGLVVFSQTKHALLIGIGNYPERKEGNSWSDLSSENDINLVQGMLKEQGFSEKNISVLLNEQATTANTMQKMDDLINKVTKGDIIYIHFSGHGQQIADLNPTEYPKLKYIAKDEGDGYDEALVMYDGPMVYTDGYDFTGHLIDDQLEYYVSGLETAIGAEGHLVFVLDACHSGSGTRGAATAKQRGASIKCEPKDYIPDYKIRDTKNYFNSNNSNIQNGIKSVFMGCKDEEINFELKSSSYGSLTFALVEAISNLKEQASYKNVFKHIYGTVLNNSNSAQHAESVLDQPNSLFFGGKIIPADDYFQIENISLKTFVIKAGIIHGIEVGDSILIEPIKKSDENKLGTFKGVVNNVTGATCDVYVESSKAALNKDASGFFQAKRVYSVLKGQQLKIAIEVNNKDFIKSFKNALKQKPNIQIVNDAKEKPDYFVKEVGKTGKVILEIPFSGYAFKQMNGFDMKNTNTIDSLIAYLDQALRIDYFSSLELDDSRLNYSVRIDTISKNLIDKEILTQAGNSTLYAFKPIITNSSSHKLYIYCLLLSSNKTIQNIKLDSKNDFLEMFPNTNNTDDAVPQYLICDNNFDCGNHKLFFFGSRDKLDFTALTELGKSLASTRGSAQDEFSKLINDGASGKSRSAKSTSGVKLIKFEFELVP